MIPTMILLGLAFGHWWRSTLVVAAVLWPSLLLATGVIDVSAQILGAALFGLANAGAGVAIHQGVAWTVRRLRAHQRPVAASPSS
jgi:hypothetical protein